MPERGTLFIDVGGDSNVRGRIVLFHGKVDEVVWIMSFRDESGQLQAQAVKRHDAPIEIQHEVDRIVAMYSAHTTGREPMIGGK